MSFLHKIKIKEVGCNGKTIWPSADEGERILVEDETTIYEVDVRCMECQKEKGHRFLNEEKDLTGNKKNI